jgi:hypothetical protein
MGAASNDLETKLLNYTLRNTGFTAPSSVYVGLCSATPTETAANEFSTTYNYTRKQIVFNAASGSSITGGNATITFNQATGGNWGTTYGYALFDASTGGNYLYYGTFNPSVAINQNDTVELASGAIVITLD